MDLGLDRDRPWVSHAESTPVRCRCLLKVGSHLQPSCSCTRSGLRGFARKCGNQSSHTMFLQERAEDCASIVLCTPPSVGLVYILPELRGGSTNPPSLFLRFA